MNNEFGLIKPDPRETAIVKATDQFSRGDISGMLEILSRGNESASLALFQASVSSLASSYSRGQLDKRALSRQMRLLCDLDDSKDPLTGRENRARFVAGLQELPDEHFLAVTSTLPVKLLETLDRPDLEVCEPSRIAAYIRTVAFQTNKQRHRLNRISWANHGRKLRQRSVVTSDFRTRQEELLLLIETVSDRDDDPESPEFMWEVARDLCSKEDGSPLPYVLVELQDLAEAESGAANLLLRCLGETKA